MRFRRKDDAATDETTSAAGAAEGADTAGAGAPASSSGPYDFADTPADDIERIDLGGLLVQPPADHEVRLQVDEESGEVHSVVILGEEGALEMRAFAAPRNGDLWAQVRPDLIEDVTGRGGTAEEAEGPFGAEVRCVIPVELEDGSTGGQPTRVIAANGPRWMLRGNLMGLPAMQPEDERCEFWHDLFAATIVRRGDGAMPVGTPIPMQLPPDATPAD